MPLAVKDWSRFEALLDQGLTIQQVRQMGYDAVWKKSTVCPNRILKKEDHDINCKVCDGLGFLYDVVGTNIRALVTSIGLKQMWQTSGRFDVGMGIITVEPMYKISWWDMVEFPNALIRYSQVLQRAADGKLIDKARYPVIEPVRFVDPKGADYEWGEDFNIDSDGKIEWIVGGRKPVANAFYSVSYLCHPRYILLELVHQVRESQTRQVGPIARTEFPLQAVGKLDFLWGDESKES